MTSKAESITDSKIEVGCSKTGSNDEKVTRGRLLSEWRQGEVEKGMEKGSYKDDQERKKERVGKREISYTNNVIWVVWRYLQSNVAV